MISKIIFKKRILKVCLFICACLTVQISAAVRPKVVVIPLLTDSDSSQTVNNVIRVALEGGDFRRVEDAVESITDASSSNPYLVTIAPGEYRLKKALELKSHVRVEGSGIRTTVLVGDLLTTSNRNCGAVPVVIAGEDSSAWLTNVTITNAGSAADSRAGVCASLDSQLIRLDEVEIIVRDAASNYGVVNNGGGGVINNAGIFAEGRVNSSGENYGIFSRGFGSIRIVNSVISARTVIGATAETFGIVLGDIQAFPGTAGGGDQITNSRVDSLLIGGAPDTSATITYSNVGVIEVRTGNSFTAFSSQFSEAVIGSGIGKCAFSTVDLSPLNQDCSIAVP